MPKIFTPHIFLLSHINIWTTQSSRSNKSKGNKIKWVKVNIISVFTICRNVNSFWNFHLTFFFSPLLLLQSSIPSFHFISQNLVRTLFIIFFLTLFPSSFFLFFSFLPWILFQTTTFKQTDQIPSWNIMDKGFKKEKLIKRLNGVTRDNVSRKRKKTYMAQSRQKWPNLISQWLV